MGRYIVIAYTYNNLASVCRLSAVSGNSTRLCAVLKHACLAVPTRQEARSPVFMYRRPNIGHIINDSIYHLGSRVMQRSPIHQRLTAMIFTRGHHHLRRKHESTNRIELPSLCEIGVLNVEGRPVFVF